MQRAHVHMMKHDFAGAIDWFEHVREVDDEFCDIYHGYGMLYLEVSSVGPNTAAPHEMICPP